jgi:hypothetical protein
LLQQVEQQFRHLASQQNLMHENMHQIIAQVNALSFDQSNAGQGSLRSFNRTAAAADKDVAGTSEVAHERQLMGAILAVVLSRPQAVMPMALLQR